MSTIPGMEVQDITHSSHLEVGEHGQERNGQYMDAIGARILSVTLQMTVDRHLAALSAAVPCAFLFTLDSDSLLILFFVSSF